MAVLQMLKGISQGQVYPLESDRAILGRHPDCDVVLEVGAVSRQHAQIIREGQQFFVEDLNSRNGTYVNGRMIEGRTLLKENDRVKICDMLFTFHYDQPGPETGGSTIEDSDILETPNVTVEDDTTAPPTSTIMSTISMAESANLRVGVRPEAKLKALIEISQNLTKSLKIEEILPKILESLFKVFPQADRGFVLLSNEDGTLVPKAVRHRRADSDEQVRVSRTIINQVLRQKEAILSADAATDTRFDMAQSIADFRIRSMMCVPIFNKDGDPLGVIQLDTQDQMQKFEQEDLDVLTSVASQVVFLIENAKLHETVLEKQKTEQDIQFAKKVQQGFLPATHPEVNGYAFFDYYNPARQIGGDYFDYIPLPDERLAIALGDVSGKGVSAALLMAKLSSEVRYCLVSQPTPAASVDLLNLQFCRSGWDDRFVTFVLLVVDIHSHRVDIVNAGHMPPLLRTTDGKIIDLDQETNLPLGVAEEVSYVQYTHELSTGESLTLFTDGINEAMNTKRDLYGLGRLREKLAAGPAEVSQLGKSILEDVRTFIGGHPQSDDMCLVCVGRNG